MSFSTTTEQQAILDAFATGGSLVIDAGAGAGKTSTLRLMAESTDRKGIYVAYNKAIATDAKASFPANVKCATAHSFAFQAVGKRFSRRLNAPRVTSRQVVNALGIPSQGFQMEPLSLQPWVVAGLVMTTVSRFCSSADDEITTKHVPFVEGAEGAMDALRSFVAPFAKKAWADLNNPAGGDMRFTHDHYLKMWALTNPKLDCDFILLDEAQDANPVIAQVVQNQTHAQQIMVGDRNQAIYGWRGAVDAMTTFKADHRLVLSQSFRFGDAVAVEANKWLELLNAPLRIRGFEAIASTVETLASPDAILCRTNAEVVSQALAFQGNGKTVAIVGGAGEIKRFAEAADKLMSGERTNHPELLAFKSWGEVVEHSKEDDGRDLRVMVSLIENHGVEILLAVCDSSVSEAKADIIISTAHKAKGREWDSVKIAGDFKCPDAEKGEKLSAPEMMLAYVAVTRARKVLDNAGLAWVDNFVATAA